MDVRSALEEYYSFQPYLSDDKRDNTYITFYLGKWDLKVPNFKSSEKKIINHDLHHIITGYGTDRIGEGEVAAWQLGTGILFQPIGMAYSLAGLFTGLLLSFNRTDKAFKVGRRNCNLYSVNVSEIINSDIAKIKTYCSHQSGCRPSLLDAPIFAKYFTLSLFMALGVIGFFAPYHYYKSISG